MRQPLALFPAKSPISCLFVSSTLVASAALSGLAACSSDDGAGDDAAISLPATYAFSSQLKAGASSVAYTGQVQRQLLIHQISELMEGATDAIDGGKAPKAGELEASLLFLYDFDPTTGGGAAIGWETTPPSLQSTWGDLGSDARLSNMIAGKDAIGQHRDWETKGLLGWPEAKGPDALIRGWIKEFDKRAVDRAAGKIGTGADGKPLASVQVTEQGHNLQELVQKLLLGAVAYSQAADDYLDDDTPGKGLLSDHSKGEEDGDAATALEHAWDEAFGYFGAARDYGDYSAADLAGNSTGARNKGVFDTDGDGKIDLRSEANYGFANYCGRRDDAAAAIAPTKMKQRVWDAFRRGRTRLAATKPGAVPTATLTALKADRDDALRAWEECIAANVIHYSNEALGDLAKAAAGKGWDHAEAAGHWSEAKAFALALQFSRFSMLSEAQLEELHAKMGDAPTLGNADAAAIAKAQADLRAARQLVVDAYGFDAKLRGDDNGEGGW